MQIVVFVHLSFDDPAFSASPMTHEEEDEDEMWGGNLGVRGDAYEISSKETFKLTRMMPPGTFQYYFMVFGDGKFLMRWNGAGMEAASTPHSCSFVPKPLAVPASPKRNLPSRELSHGTRDDEDDIEDDDDLEIDPHSKYCRPESYAKDTYDGSKQPTSTSPTKPFLGGHGTILSKCSFHTVEVSKI